MPSCHILILLVALFVARSEGEVLQQVGALPRRSDGSLTPTAEKNLKVAQSAAVNAAAALASAVTAASAISPEEVAAAAAADQQLSALLAVKGIIDRNGVLNSLWTGTDYCFWPGIVCDTQNRVTNLNIWAGTGITTLKGKLPPAKVLRGLPFLTNITIGDNRGITGPIPSDYNTLVNLLDLRLGQNRLSGALPDKLSALTKLRVLYLYSNSFSKQMPASWSSLTELTDLQVSSNRLTGALPPSWRSLTKLRYLYVFDNSKMAGGIPNYGSMTSLLELAAYNIRLDRTLPANLRTMRSLTTLQLYKNSLKGSIPSSWSALRNMNYIDVSSNALQGSIPASLGPTWQVLGQGDNGGFFVNNNANLVGCIPKDWQVNLPEEKYDTLGTGITGFCP